MGIPAAEGVGAWVSPVPAPQPAKNPDCLLAPLAQALSLAWFLGYVDPIGAELPDRVANSSPGGLFRAQDIYGSGAGDTVIQPETIAT